jgi:hypothetical protein
VRSGDCSDAFDAVNDWRKERDAEARARRLRTLALDNASQVQ